MKNGDRISFLLEPDNMDLINDEVSPFRLDSGYIHCTGIFQEFFQETIIVQRDEVGFVPVIDFKALIIDDADSIFKRVSVDYLKLPEAQLTNA